VSAFCDQRSICVTLHYLRTTRAFFLPRRLNVPVCPKSPFFPFHSRLRQDWTFPPIMTPDSLLVSLQIQSRTPNVSPSGLQMPTTPAAAACKGSRSFVPVLPLIPSLLFSLAADQPAYDCLDPGDARLTPSPSDPFFFFPPLFPFSRLKYALISSHKITVQWLRDCPTPPRTSSLLPLRPGSPEYRPRLLSQSGVKSERPTWFSDNHTDYIVPADRPPIPPLFAHFFCLSLRSLPPKHYTPDSHARAWSARISSEPRSPSSEYKTQSPRFTAIDRFFSPSTVARQVSPPLFWSGMPPHPNGLTCFFPSRVFE